jgi:5,10-methylenetetrahydromethanopterin reductase
MEFGIGRRVPHNLKDLVEWGQLIESYGFDYVGLADSQSLQPDPYVALALMAGSTRVVHMGPEATNPITRHPAVTASAIASINRISGGRAFITVASGDSAIENIGLHPARLSELREYLLTLRALFNGESCTYKGARIHTKWIRDDIPIVLAAEGPKTLCLAGEVADVALVHTGLTPQILDATIGHIRDGERAAGRPLGTVKVAAFAYCRVADSREEALQPIKGGISASANHAFRVTLEGKHVPTEFVEPILTLRKRYNNAEHGDRGTPSAALPDELGLTEFLAERFSIAGTPEECREKVKMVESHGVSAISLAMRFDDGDKDMTALRRIAEELVTPLRR